MQKRISVILMTLLLLTTALQPRIVTGQSEAVTTLSSPVEADDSNASFQESEPNDDKSSANPIGIGALNYMEASVRDKDDTDWFKFSVEVTQTVAIETFDVTKAINPSHPMQLIIYDSKDSEIARDTQYYPVYANGAGNVNAAVNFLAKAGVTYFLQAYPYRDSAASGSYKIRVVPSFDQSESFWDSNHEPNNWFSSAYELKPGSLNAITTTIEERDASFMTMHPDKDVYRFQTTEAGIYVIETFNVSKAINPLHPMQLFVYDKNLAEVAKDAEYYPVYANGTNNVSSELN